MMNWLPWLTLTALVVAELPLAAAFTPTERFMRVTTSMSSIVFEPQEDNYECEESVFAVKKREREQHDDAVKARYLSEYGIELAEADLNDSVDQYQNAAGGGIIAGIGLTSLCCDD
mmetsp:Transcript_132/g.305  ORF Transcript_132/g.305 Transcript_132/m.305 type:complete len:116 (-) Transcript_132:2591-2938(-)